jgi:hypothetical protein
METRMSDIATMLIGVSSDYLHDRINLEAFRMNVNFALESIDRELKSEKQAIEAVFASKTELNTKQVTEQAVKESLTTKKQR